VPAVPEPEQLGFEGMPRRLFAATPSRLSTFTACPRRYRFTYLIRPTPPKGPPWAHNSLGAAVHNALRDWWSLPLARRTPVAAARLVDAGWIADGFADARQSATWRSRARDWVEAYVAELDPADEPVGVERGVAVRTDRLALSGRVDRIDGRAGELVIVDYKTGRWVPDTDDARGSLALAVYALAAGRTLRRSCRRVELHHLPTGRVAGPPTRPTTSSGRRPRWPAAPTSTRPTRRRPGGSARGATSAGTARPARPRPRSRHPGRASPNPPPSHPTPPRARTERISPWRSPRRSSSSGTTTVGCSR
jgi:RecB family exonuclease